MYFYVVHISLLLKKIFFITFFLFSYSLCKTQSITGIWEGDLDGTEFLQLNITQVGKNACGFTWDYTYRNKADHCKAYCNASYNKIDRTWFISGYSFFENSGTHVLMQISAAVMYERGNVILKGLCRTSPSILSPGGEPVEIKLRKVSNKPNATAQPIAECINIYKATQKKKEPQKEKTKPQQKPLVKKPIAKPFLKPIQKPIKKNKIDSIPIKKIDTLKKAEQKINPTITNGRANKAISHIVVNDRKIKLQLYDNGIVDGDSVTIFYNNKILLRHQRLSEKPIDIDLVLDENTNLHSILLFAENLGSIPPNTALIIFTTPAGKRYELFSSATLEENAELIFEYKPK